MRSNLFGSQLAKPSGNQVFTAQNDHMLKVSLNNTEVTALKGSMVAYQGALEFDTKFYSVGKFLKKAVTGEELPLMLIRGVGEVYIAHKAAEVHLVYLENDSLTISSQNVLAFESTLDWDIKRVHGMGVFTEAGWFNVAITGTGWVALMAHGSPVVLQPAAAPTYVDFAAAVAWSTDLETSLHHSFNWKVMIGRGSGEAWQMGFKGDGIVVVQASESPDVNPDYGPKDSGDTSRKS